MKVTVIVVGDMPNELAKTFLQHIRDFDSAHEGVHLNVRINADDMTTEQIVEVLRQIDPPFAHHAVFKREP